MSAAPFGHLHWGDFDPESLVELKRWQQLGWAMTIRAGSATKKLVLLVAAERANAHGMLWVDQDTIAHDAEVTRRTVGRALTELEEAGHIRRFPRYRDRGDLVGKRTSDVTVLGCNLSGALGVPGLPDTVSHSGGSLPDTVSHSGGSLCDIDDTEQRSLQDTVSQQDLSSLEDLSTSNDVPAKPKPSRRTAVPDGFTPRAEDVSRVTAQGLDYDGDGFVRETERFSDHHRAKGSKMADWHAAWRTWIRSEYRRPRTAAPVPQIRPGVQRLGDLGPAVRAAKARQGQDRPVFELEQGDVR